MTNISLLVVGRHSTAASGGGGMTLCAFQFAACGSVAGARTANPLAKIDRRHMRGALYSASTTDGSRLGDDASARRYANASA